KMPFSKDLFHRLVIDQTRKDRDHEAQTAQSPTYHIKQAPYSREPMRIEGEHPIDGRKRYDEAVDDKRRPRESGHLFEPFCRVVESGGCVLIVRPFVEQQRHDQEDPEKDEAA